MDLMQLPNGTRLMVRRESDDLSVRIVGADPHGWDVGFRLAGWSVAYQKEPGNCDPCDALVILCAADTFLVPDDEWSDASWRMIAEAKPTWVVLDVRVSSPCQYGLARLRACGYRAEIVPGFHGMRAHDADLNWVRWLIVGSAEGADTDHAWSFLEQYALLSGEMAFSDGLRVDPWEGPEPMAAPSARELARTFTKPAWKMA
jgi:hypothetical protein